MKPVLTYGPMSAPRGLGEAQHAAVRIGEVFSPSAFPVQRALPPTPAAVASDPGMEAVPASLSLWPTGARS